MAIIPYCSSCIIYIYVEGFHFSLGYVNIQSAMLCVYRNQSPDIVLLVLFTKIYHSIDCES